MTTVTFIGDVHGYLDRVHALEVQAVGELIFLGDLVDRGPEVRTVVQYVRVLCDAGRARCVLGNHEYALVRGLGVPSRGIEPWPELFEQWCTAYGGLNTVRSYGADPEPESLRAAMGDDLEWMADLPWILEGDANDTHWVAVHAGLSAASWEVQRAALYEPQSWWTQCVQLPMQLYHKAYLNTVPWDWPTDHFVVSGHVPLMQAVVMPYYAHIDTSGGMPERPLSGLIFPERRVISSHGGPLV